MDPVALGEKQHEVGQFRVGAGIGLGQQDVPQFLGSRERPSQLTDLPVARRKGPAPRAFGWRDPAHQELLASFAEFALKMRQQAGRPQEGAIDPTPQFPTFQQVEAAG